MEVQGTIKLIDETKTFGASEFKKRELVLTTQEQFPQHLSIEFVQDKCDLLDTFEVGQMVQIGINLRGREWVNPQGGTKYFNSIQGWRIDLIEDREGVDDGYKNQDNPTYEPAAEQPVNAEEDHDDIAF